MSTEVIGVELEGVAELRRVLRGMSAEAQEQAVKAAAMAGAEPIRAAAAANAPVLKAPDPRRRAGNLKSKVTSWLSSLKPGAATVQVGINRRDLRVGVLAAFYAPWVEFGTKFMAAIPFLRQAFDAHYQEAGRRSIQVFEDFLAKWGAE